MDIKVKYFDGQVPLEKIKVGDWIDLRCNADIGMLGDPFKKIPLGVAMQLPKLYEAHIVPRGSTFKHWGLIQTNHMGVIDESYCGPNDEWFWPAYVLKPNSKIIKIPRGTRLAQFRIMKKQPTLVFKENDLEDNTDRGGHGSTGKS